LCSARIRVFTLTVFLHPEDHVSCIACDLSGRSELLVSVFIKLNDSATSAVWTFLPFLPHPANLPTRPLLTPQLPWMCARPPSPLGLHPLYNATFLLSLQEGSETSQSWFLSSVTDSKLLLQKKSESFSLSLSLTQSLTHSHILCLCLSLSLSLTHTHTHTHTQTHTALVLLTIKNSLGPGSSGSRL
jgi:hypothetical protein